MGNDTSLNVRSRHVFLFLLLLPFVSALSARNETRKLHPFPKPSNIKPADLKACAASMNGKLPVQTPSDFKFSGHVRRYYIAAEEVNWNYAPTGWDNWLGVPIHLSPRAKQYEKYGTTYTKALYRGYTDSTFSQRSEQPPWQGTQGPTIRSEVGDLVEILFVNSLETNYATMHSMGLAYTKVSEGSDYPDITVGGVSSVLPPQDAVPPIEAGIGPGSCVVYKWMADDLAGPNEPEPAATHSYHSYVALDVDSNAGLIGPSIVYARGKMESTMASYREFPLLYNIFDEYTSFMSSVNAERLGHYDPNGQFGPNLNTKDLWHGNVSIWRPQLVNLNSSGHLGGAPMFHALNGYVFANNPTFEMCKDDKVIWYLNAYGAASHVFHMHGNGFVQAGRKQYAISINDGVGFALYMTAYGTGLWQVVCHVQDHHQEGMVSNYRVYNDPCPLKPLKKPW